MKPPILSDETISDELAREFRRVSGKEPGLYFNDVSANDRLIATAQRDADAAYYEPLIERLIEQTRKLLKPIEQAKAEVAREIFEEIEKVENPHVSISARNGFEVCREKILTLQSKYGGKK